MPFITQGKTNWKYILIVVILAFLVGGGALWYSRGPEKPYQPPEIKKPEKIIKDEETLAKEIIIDFMDARMGKFGEESLTRAKSHLTDNGKKSYSQIEFIDFALVGISNPHYSRYEILKSEKLNSNKFEFTVRIYEYLVETKEKGDFDYFDEELTVIKIDNNYLVDSMKRSETVVIQAKTANWKTYRNEEYGFEVKYPKNWNLSSWNITNPSNPGYKVLIKNEDNNKESLTISITANFPSLPDFDTNAPLSQKLIGGLKTQEQIFPNGWCDVLGCTDPFIGLWIKNKGYIYTFEFNNTVAITGIYNQIISTFRFLE